MRLTAAREWFFRGLAGTVLATIALLGVAMLAGVTAVIVIGLRKNVNAMTATVAITDTLHHN